MPADPPPSPLITPDLRRRLQQRYEEAVRLLNQQAPDRARTHALLAECLQADPGNILYLNALVANLRQWSPKGNRGWWKGWLGTSKSVPMADREGARRLLDQGPEILLDHHRDPTTLRSLAAACAECDFDEAELRYLFAAREIAPDDPVTLQMLARALTRQGRFAEAQGVWERLLTIAPDAEAAQAVQDLQLVPTRAEQVDLPAIVSAHPASVAEAVAAAAQLTRAGQFVVAEELLTSAQAAFGGDLSVRQAIEELQLAKSEHRLEIARRRAAHDAHPKAQFLVGQLEAEHLHLEIEILNVRCERLPGERHLRLELARKLKRAGNYSGAIQRLEEIKPTRSVSEGNTLARSASEGFGVGDRESRVGEPTPTRSVSQGHDPTIAVFIELGECWQHLRQFAKALDFYEQAAVTAPLGTTEQKLALYRAGSLATAMDKREAARQHFATLVAADPAFKDARERLDKLNST